MTRPMTILAVMQVMLVIVGFFALGLVLKVSGYPDLPEARWNPLAVFLREHGAWLLGLPVAWVLWANLAQRVDRGLLSQWLAYLIGVLLAGAIVGLFLMAMVRPFTLPLIIGR